LLGPGLKFGLFSCNGGSCTLLSAAARPVDGREVMAGGGPRKIRYGLHSFLEPLGPRAGFHSIRNRDSQVEGVEGAGLPNPSRPLI